MALKLMLFIDGTWLYSSLRLMTKNQNEGLRIDFGKLPKVLLAAAKSKLPHVEVDLVRTHLFGSYAVNFDNRDDELVQSRVNFFNILREEFNYDVETYTVDYRGRRLRFKDRDPNDDFIPVEKCVDVAVASSMLFMSAIPNACDIFLLVAGDRDYVPALQKLRLLGKRVMIASIKANSPKEYKDQKEDRQIRDYDIIWLDDILSEIELKNEIKSYECSSNLHKNPQRTFWSTEAIKNGKPICPSCVAEMKRLSQEDQKNQRRIPVIEKPSAQPSMPVVERASPPPPKKVVVTPKAQPKNTVKPRISTSQKSDETKIDSFAKSTPLKQRNPQLTNEPDVEPSKAIKKASKRPLVKKVVIKKS